MSFRKLLLAIAAATAVAITFAPAAASARHRGSTTHHRGVVTRVVVDDYCGGRLPAYGVDACGFPEFSYGDGCWRRVIVHTPDGLRPRRVRTCGPEV